MSLHDHPKKCSPEITALSTPFTTTFGADSMRAYRGAKRPGRSWKLRLVTLAALVTDGVTDPKELRRRAFESLPLKLG